MTEDRKEAVTEASRMTEQLDVGPFLSWLKGNPHTDPWKRMNYEVIADAVARDHRVAESRTALDVGCGDGLFSLSLRNRLPRVEWMVGFDIEHSPYWPARSDVNAWLVGSASASPIRPGSVELVVAKDVIHHADDPRAVVEALVNSATKCVVIVEANLANPVMSLYTKYNKDQHYSLEALKALIQTASPNSDWNFSTISAYPFYLPPVTGWSAVWVWPLTALMLLAFKMFRSRRLARWFMKVAFKLSPPPFNLACLVKSAT